MKFRFLLYLKTKLPIITRTAGRNEEPSMYIIAVEVSPGLDMQLKRIHIAQSPKRIYLEFYRKLDSYRKKNPRLIMRAGYYSN